MRRDLSTRLDALDRSIRRPGPGPIALFRGFMHCPETPDDLARLAAGCRADLEANPPRRDGPPSMVAMILGWCEEDLREHATP